MKAKIEFIIKHNSVVQAIYKVVMGLIFRLLGCFCRTDDNLVLLVSYSGKSYSDSPRVIYEAMRKREDCASLKYVWAFNEPNKVAVPGARSVKMDSLAYFIVALKAKYWITNVNIERGLKFKKKDTVYLNTWHGTPIKYIGNAAPGRSDYDFSRVDIISSDGEFFTQRMIEDFNARPKSILTCGRPSDDALFDSDFIKRGPEIREKLGIRQGSLVILYAPTWRESADGGVSFSFEPPLNVSRWKEMYGLDCTLLFRAHSMVNSVSGMQVTDSVIDVSDYPDVNELMLASDLLISDYSGIYFDYAITGKPMLCYCYDYEEYSRSRGMYFDVRNYLTSFDRETALVNYLIDIDFDYERKKTRDFFFTFSGEGGNGAPACINRLLEIGNTK